MTGIELIAKERQEQIEKHGRTIESDVNCNNHYQLSQAASLLIGEVLIEDYEASPSEMCPSEWDEGIWEKMCRKPYKDRLIIAGALIAAELDRIEFLNA